MTTAVDVKQVSKQYGTVRALDRVSLSIADQEFFTLLGPSGCGKTTLLRIIAGFESVTEGSVHLHGKEIADLPANQRPVNTVFQQYSLFPHMSVIDNVKFGLQMKGVDGAQTLKRSQQMLELVQLSEFADRKPSQLSGGQQQRVALARALAPEPEVLLLDEPLSALDLKLRQAMRMELKQIQQETGITFIFVTHDQEEALTMSDRIAVMSAGLVQQVGSAHDIYEHPNSRFVADFIGETNLLESRVLTADGKRVTCELAGTGSIAAEAVDEVSPGTAGILCIRPERLRLSAGHRSDAPLKGAVQQRVYLGTDTQTQVRLDNGVLMQVRSQNTSNDQIDVAVGDAVSLDIDRGAARFLVN